jgi:hypothetical protein
LGKFFRYQTGVRSITLLVVAHILWYEVLSQTIVEHDERTVAKAFMGFSREISFLGACSKRKKPPIFRRNGR